MQDENGTTWLSYKIPAQRYGVGELARAAVTAMTAALNTVATKATAP